MKIAEDGTRIMTVEERNEMFAAMEKEKLGIPDVVQALKKMNEILENICMRLDKSKDLRS